MKKFYMVFNITTKGPTKVMHCSYTKAVEEAKRLALATPGHEFTVLEAQVSFQVQPLVVMERLL